jgi:hypothetical protein
VPPSGPYQAFYKIYGSGFDQSAFALTPDRAPDAVAVRYCRSDGQACSTATAITPSGAPAPVDVSVSAVCTAPYVVGLPAPNPAPGDVTISAAAKASATVTVDSVGDNGDNGPIMTQYTITFSGAFASIGTVYLDRCTQ